MALQANKTADSVVVRRHNPRDGEFARGLLAVLVEKGDLTQPAAARALQAQRETGERIDTVLAQLGLLTDEALVDALAHLFGMPILRAAQIPDLPVMPDLFHADFLRRNRLLPLAETGGHLLIATADPFASDTLASASYMAECPIEVVVAQARDIEKAIDRLYEASEGAKAADGPAATDGAAKEDDVQRLRDIASEAPIIRFVTRMIAAAVEQRASDIHIEPLADGVRVRYRVDGVMAEVDRLPLDMQAGIASRIKILGNLNIAERRLPQDGRTKAVVGGREIDLRLSTAPVMHGESVVMRILDREAVELDFTSLGFDAMAQSRLRALLSAPNGIILVTGPTGSGKTTTLYTALKELNSIERKVFTVEDPIEYQLPGVNQMQIKPAIGLDFVHCLRSILRQDPDVVMIGEMRDVETARTGIQASLTGHLVLSTLHTNSAAASITRLLDMGVEDYLLGSTVSGILAQRLVRRLCTSCAAPDPEARAAIAALGTTASRIVSTQPRFAARKAVGCPHCRQTGYKGRTTIFELLAVDHHVRPLIKRGVTDRDIEIVARDHGMETLLENGLRKIADGETTLDDVLRVART